jgi:hypothetical protein
LYLRLFDSGGQIFTDSQKVMDALASPSVVDHLKSIKWESLSQQPHPLLQVIL